MSKKDNNYVVTQALSQPKERAIAGEIVGLVIGLVVLYMIMPRLAFVTPMYSMWLPIGVAATVGSCILKIAGIILTPLAHPTKALALGIQIYSTYALLKIFPFDFGTISMSSLDSIFGLALMVAIIGMTVALLVEMYKSVELLLGLRDS